MNDPLPIPARGRLFPLSPRHPAWFDRLTHWEFWPAWIFYLPIAGYWLLFALRARTPWFVASVNPGIPTGGFFGESKFDLQQRLPDVFKPRTLRFDRSAAFVTALGELEQAGIAFPVMAKPDVGHRGWRVEKCATPADLARYYQSSHAPFLVQEYVTLPEDLAVMYYRHPGADRGTVTSITRKMYPTVVGDGQATLAELVGRHPRARLYGGLFSRRHAGRWRRVVPAGETVLLNDIGNHCRGALFLNANAWIDPALTAFFDRLTDHLPEVYYCRYDLKCASVAALRAGRDVKVVEVNGVAADPTHVYDPDYSLFQAYRDIWRHWRVMYAIARANRARGFAYPAWRAVLPVVRAYRDYLRQQREHDLS